MKKKSILILALTLSLMAAFTVSGMAAGLSVNTNENYSTGEPVLIMITSDQNIDPANVKINIEKPNGTTVETTPRRQGWNSTNECFDTYTIDLSGAYTISVSDQSTGQTASTKFVASIFNGSSIVFMIISVIIFAVSMVGWIITNRRKRA